MFKKEHKCVYTNIGKYLIIRNGRCHPVQGARSFNLKWFSADWPLKTGCSISVPPGIPLSLCSTTRLFHEWNCIRLGVGFLVALCLCSCHGHALSIGAPQLPDSVPGNEWKFFMGIRARAGHSFNMKANCIKSHLQANLAPVLPAALGLPGSQSLALSERDEGPGPGFGS